MSETARAARLAVGGSAITVALVVPARLVGRRLEPDRRIAAYCRTDFWVTDNVPLKPQGVGPCSLKWFAKSAPTFQSWSTISRFSERESIAAAYRQGCAAISLEGLPDADRPQFAVRDGVDAEQLVLAADPTTNPPEASANREKMEF